jgi:hypothetical protein
VHGRSVGCPEGRAGCPGAARDQVEIFKDLAAGPPRLVGQVSGRELEDVEDEERDRMAVPLVAATVDAVAQKLEVGPTIGGEHDYLAVEHYVPGRGETVELGESVHPFASGPGPQPHPGRLHLGQAAEPVELGLMHPAFPGRWFRHRGGEHRSVRRSHLLASGSVR